MSPQDNDFCEEEYFERDIEMGDDIPYDDVENDPEYYGEPPVIIKKGGAGCCTKMCAIIGGITILVILGLFGWHFGHPESCPGFIKSLCGMFAGASESEP